MTGPPEKRGSQAAMQSRWSRCYSPYVTMQRGDGGDMGFLQDWGHRSGIVAALSTTWKAQCRHCSNRQMVWNNWPVTYRGTLSRGDRFAISTSTRVFVIEPQQDNETPLLPTAFLARSFLLAQI